MVVGKLLAASGFVSLLYILGQSVVTSEAEVDSLAETQSVRSQGFCWVLKSVQKSKKI